MKYNNFCIELGKIKVMMSAPHCVDHLRNKKIKKGEVNTDTLIKRIKEKIDISIIYKTTPLSDDPNYDEKSEYKEELAKVIKEQKIIMLLDIHGMDYRRKEDICIGTAHGKNLNNRSDILEYAVKVFKDAGYSNVTIDEPFSADNINCVSTYISKNCSIASLQIEINNKYRYEKSIEFDLEKLSNCFVELIKKITE